MGPVTEERWTVSSFLWVTLRLFVFSPRDMKEFLSKPKPNMFLAIRQFGHFVQPLIEMTILLNKYYIFSF